MHPEPHPLDERKQRTRRELVEGCVWVDVEGEEVGRGGEREREGGERR